MIKCCFIIDNFENINKNLEKIFEFTNIIYFDKINKYIY
jgi:hypothetical protein